MFNFDELKVIKGKESEERKCGSFVGIRRDKDTKEMHFILPRGFEDFDPNYNNIKKLFFNMYKTFKKFIDERKDLSKVLDDKPQSKDNVSVESNGSYCFVDSDDNEVIMYSKIEMIEAMIQVHKDLDVEALIQEAGLVEEIDYSKIDNLINNGVFLKNHSIVIDFMVGERNTIQGIPAEIIEIYCYIYNELLVELNYDINDRVKDIAYNFSYKNLTAEQGLFNEYTFESTIIVLKDRLDLVHRHTAYKDSSYWLIYDAVEKFLYSGLVFDSENEKGFWGINNFYQIWEDMCNNFFIKSFGEKKLLYCDTELSFENQLDNVIRKRFGGFSVLIDESFDNNFYIVFNNNKRWMRPDLVVTSSNDTPIEILLKLGVISYRIEKSNTSLINKGNVRINFMYKNIEGTSKKMEDLYYKTFYDVVLMFEFMKRNKIKKESNLLPTIVIKKINKTLFEINGISEKVFLFELGNIINNQRDGLRSNSVECIDWKYLPLSYFKHETKELKSNVAKQLTYDFCLHNNSYFENKSVQSQFGVPYYIENNENFEFHNDVDSSLQGIQVCKMNFNKIQSVYLNE